MRTHLGSLRDLQHRSLRVFLMTATLTELGKFGTIVVDPPWAFTFSTRKSEAGNNGWRGSTDRHYRNMSIRELQAMPIPDVAADDCVLWLWAVNALLDDAIGLMKHWGFDYKNTLTWAKTASHGGPSVGMGFWMRGATEHLLLGVKGKPKPLRRNQPTWFAAPPGRHSAKPEAAYDLIETLTPGPYLDVFARRQRDGWACWGDEVSTPPAPSPQCPSCEREISPAAQQRGDLCGSCMSEGASNA
jgi:N6-adenosine-specific RNA methylase IME4